MLKVNEIFYSLQGESTHAGRPCVFVRLTGCNLRCTYCDTEYAFHEGRNMSIDDILAEVRSYDCRLVEVTGGEPLMQPESIELMVRLVAEGYEVMLETGGSLPVDKVHPEVIKIIDFKTPSSGMAEKNLWSILDHLAPHDEIKFVIGDRKDFEWACTKVAEHDLARDHHVLFSPVHEDLSPVLLAEWLLNNPLQKGRVRLQFQLHKQIWGPEARGV
ncbi:radical SAM protein [Candidatus Neomarinimicrobiota bacterium]